MMIGVEEAMGGIQSEGREGKTEAKKKERATRAPFKVRHTVGTIYVYGTT